LIDSRQSINSGQQGGVSVQVSSNASAEPRDRDDDTSDPMADVILTEDVFEGAQGN